MLIFTPSYAAGIAADLALAAQRYGRLADAARSQGRRRNLARQAAILRRAAARWRKVAGTARALTAPPAPLSRGDAA